MSAYMLLCNFTDQGVRTIKDAAKRRAAAREMAKKLGVEIKTGYLACFPRRNSTRSSGRSLERQAQKRPPLWGL